MSDSSKDVIEPEIGFKYTFNKLEFTLVDIKGDRAFIVWSYEGLTDHEVSLRDIKYCVLVTKKVRNTELAKLMYPDKVEENGWLL